MLTGLILLLTVYSGDYILVTGELYEGSGCSLSQGRGICQLINQCQSVYNNLLSGRRPEVVCGYQRNTPIVCCPNSNAPAPSGSNLPIWSSGGEATSTSRTTTRRTTTSRNPFANARPARRMCAEYAKSVYVLERPPVLAGGDEQLVNISLCAIKDKKLIIGGTKAEPKEFPHAAAVGYGSGSSITWNCGGTLISDRFVLTAAHCLYASQLGSAQWVRVGDLNLQRTNDDAHTQDRRIVERIKHPEYKLPRRYNDIALLKLESSVTFDAYVRPACLDIAGNHRVGEKTVAAGWGVIELTDNVGSDNLLKVTLPIVTHEMCQTHYDTSRNQLPNGILDESQMCAGQFGKDTCQGDSGGPLMIYSSEEECMYDVIGVTSFGASCGLGSPGVYSRVSHYLPWIESLVWPNLG